MVEFRSLEVKDVYKVRKSKFILTMLRCLIKWRTNRIRSKLGQVFKNWVSRDSGVLKLNQINKNHHWEQKWYLLFYVAGIFKSSSFLKMYLSACMLSVCTHVCACAQKLGWCPPLSCSNYYLETKALLEPEVCTFYVKMGTHTIKPA